MAEIFSEAKVPESEMNVDWESKIMETKIESIPLPMPKPKPQQEKPGKEISTAEKEDISIAKLEKLIYTIQRKARKYAVYIFTGYVIGYIHASIPGWFQ